MRRRPDAALRRVPQTPCVSTGRRIATRLPSPRELPGSHPGILGNGHRPGGEVRWHHELHQVAAGSVGGMLHHRRGHGHPAAGTVGAIDVTSKRPERAVGCLIKRASYLDPGGGPDSGAIRTCPGAPPFHTTAAPSSFCPVQGCHVQQRYPALPAYVLVWRWLAVQPAEAQRLLTRSP